MPSFRKPLGSVNHEYALACCGVLLVEKDYAGGNAGAVKQVCGQTDYSLEVTVQDKVLADGGLGVSTEQHAVRENTRAFATGFD